MDIAKLRPEIEGLLKELAAEEVMPLFKNLSDAQIHEKGKNDKVTQADIAVERRLTEVLPKMLPGSDVVGEEAVFHDGGLMDRIDQGGPTWIVDPVDGTNNFASGNSAFCLMIALSLHGSVRAGWIFCPAKDLMAVAEEGAGAWLNGERLRTPKAPEALTEMKAAVHLKYIPAEERDPVASAAKRFKSNKQYYCAGYTYLKVADGTLDTALFWRAKPWDHAMGSLIVREAGGDVRFADGRVYQPSIRDERGILAVADREALPRVHDLLLGHMKR